MGVSFSPKKIMGQKRPIDCLEVGAITKKRENNKAGSKRFLKTKTSYTTITLSTRKKKKKKKKCTRKNNCYKILTKVQSNCVHNVDIIWSMVYRDYALFKYIIVEEI